MICVVTGVAGFIGSHLAEKLLESGHTVRGVDKFLGNYPRRFKEWNLSQVRRPGLEFIEEDLVDIDLPALLDGVTYVFHQAAQPGVRSSWGEEFGDYTHNNILATQRLLEASKKSQIKKFVYASSSSVYGDTQDLPMRETGMTRPVSPYGVSKLSAEQLCYLYWKEFGVPTVSLRYFTVYGPRQRPDMFFHIFMRAHRRGQAIPIYDDGKQSRDFTFCADIVDGNIAAADYPGAGEVFNLGGGSRTTVEEVVRMVEKISGKKAQLNMLARQQGDVRHTSAALDEARNKLGFKPRVKLYDGLAQEWAWMQQIGD
ncbi:MAG TPA: NAD-dependent epimerase/dehydratase family protein [Candidatus Binatia bacterium]|jgi:UDP-glucose 4-epimerase